MNVQDTLRTFAELSKEAGDFQPNVLRGAHDFVWLQSSGEALFRGGTANAVAWTTGRLDGFLEQGVDEPKVDRLIGAGQLHQTEQLLRVGWVWIAGRVTTNDVTTNYCFPLLSVPVTRTASKLAKARQVSELFKTGVGAIDRVLEAVGDVELTPLITNEDRLSLLSEVHREDPGAFSLWTKRAVEATGLVVDSWATPDDGNPEIRPLEDGLVAFVGIGLYLNQAPKNTTQRAVLLQLALAKDLEESSLGAIYTSIDTGNEEPQQSVSVRPLTSRQSMVAANASAAQLAVISGAPGTGKTHVLASIAINAVAKEQSVLVVGSTRYATDVLIEHFGEIGSIQPVVFGSSRHRERFAELLVSSDGSPKEAVGRLGEEILELSRTLATEREALLHRSDSTYAAERTAELERAGDLEELASLIERHFRPRPTDLFRNNDEQIEERLDIDLSELDKACGASAVLRTELEGRLHNCLSIQAATQRSLYSSEGAAQNVAELARLTNAISRRRAEWIYHAQMSTLSKHEEGVRVQLRSMMLEKNTARRAQRIRDLDVEDLAAARLWVGALEDVHNLLPQRSNFFDIVIIDEAAQVSQPEAVGALLRAKNAILCGDPQQLRHQSNLSSEQVRAATEMFGTDPDVLDVKANSVLDVAAALVPAQLLDEHFRSVPHLIEFSNRRFYGGHLHTTTRHPSNEAADHIHVDVVANGTRTGPPEEQVNIAEATRCLKVAEMYIANGWRSIGFVSPFEAQAKRLEEMVLALYSVDEIDEYGLRVGTVRSFQGDERDVMILSWAVGADEDDSEWDEVNQDSFFNVMVTRARHQVHVVTSNPAPPGLAGEYVKWAEPLEDLEVDQPPTHQWVELVVQTLRDRNVPTRTGYRVGKYFIDVVAGSGERSVAIDCMLHVDGAEAHLERSMMLRTSGWRTAEAFEGSWAHRLHELVDDLLARFPDLTD